MIAKTVPAPLSQLLAVACLVTEDAGARARKSTNRGQLPDIWKLPTKQASTDERKLTVNLIASLSHYALCVIANLHNTVMGSPERSTLTKIVVVILLFRGRA